MKAVLSLSGGIDSSVLLSMLLDRHPEPEYEVHCCFFRYGSKHNAFELKAFNSIVDEYQNRGFNLIRKIIDVQSVFTLFNSNLLKSGGPIPEGHYEDETMKSTVIPGRNLIFASILAGYAESINADSVYLGPHAGDHAIYPDCREEFIFSLSNTVQLSSDHKVDIIAPLLPLKKASIISIGRTKHVPFDLTRTCYKEQEPACGKCGACQERLEAFKLNGFKDPINYSHE